MRAFNDGRWLETEVRLAEDGQGMTWGFALGEVRTSSVLRINEAGGPSGSVTPVHTHPGSEAFYVLTGELTQKTSHGVASVAAGNSMVGHGADSPMQVSSSGSTDLYEFALFVVDASRPFSSPAKFP